MFQRWYDEAVAAEIYEPNAMVVASVSADGDRPHGWCCSRASPTRGGSSSPTSARARAPSCSATRTATFCSRGTAAAPGQVDGIAAELPRAEVDAYFATRPRGARLGAHASTSRTRSPRAELDDAWAAADAAYPDEVPVPEEWGGFRVVLEAVEFWQGRPGRMHDRLVYRRTDAGWTTHRLAP
jgi:pyridoxamine 5'-phosphate oxidase